MGLLITGMHRSGTSMLAEWVDRLGVPMAAGEEFPLNDANARGLFESMNYVTLNEHWLAILGGSWWAPPRVKEQTWRSIDQSDLDAARTEVRDLSASGQSWFVKDPRISVLLPLWDRLTLARLPVLVGVRPHRDVAMSLHVRNGTTFRRGLAVWLDYNRQIVQHLHGRPNVLVDYDAALADPADTLAALAGFLAATGLVADAATRADGIGVQPGLRRQSTAVLDGTAERLAQDLDKHYAALRLCHNGPVTAELPAAPDWVEEALDELGEFWSLAAELESARSQLRRTLRGRLRRLARQR